MTRIFLIVVAAGILLLAVGLLVIGAFPPSPRTQPIEKVLPNDRFQSTDPCLAIPHLVIRTWVSSPLDGLPRYRLTERPRWIGMSRRSWKCWRPSVVPPATPWRLICPTWTILPLSRRGAGRASAAAARPRCQTTWRDLQTAGLSARTAARRLSALRQFHRFLLRGKAYAQDDPTGLLDTPRLPASLPKYLSEQRSTPCWPPPHRAPRAAWAAGARRRWKSSTRPGCAFRNCCRCPRTALAGDAALMVIRGKGGKERMVPLSARGARSRRPDRRFAARTGAGCFRAATRADR